MSLWSATTSSLTRLIWPCSILQMPSTSSKSHSLSSFHELFPGARFAYAQSDISLHAPLFFFVFFHSMLSLLLPSLWAVQMLHQEQITASALTLSWHGIFLVLPSSIHFFPDSSVCASLYDLQLFPRLLRASSSAIRKAPSLLATLLCSGRIEDRTGPVAFQRDVVLKNWLV